MTTSIPITSPAGPTGTAPATPTGTLGTPGVCTLGNLTFAVAPSQIAWEYHMDANVVNTIGGRVIQVYGATLGDMTIQGMHTLGTPGQVADPKAGAVAFYKSIAAMVDAQGVRPTPAQLTRKDLTPMNQPFRFTYTGDGVHQWDFSVYIKSLSDIDDPEYAVAHKTGKYTYGYQLTCFIVEDHTGELTKIATDDYIQRLSKGIGWKRTIYNGPMTLDEMQNYVKQNSPDGTIHGLVLKEYEDAAKGQIPAPGTAAADPIPGGADQAAAAQGQPGSAPDANKPPAPPAPGAPGGPPGGAAVPKNGVIPGQGGGPPIVIPGLG